MREKINKRIGRMSLLQKFVIVTALSMLLFLIANMFVFFVFNQLNSKIGNVYTDNASLENLSEKLNSLHSSVERYVSDKSTDALDAYYRNEAAFREQVEQLNDKISDDTVLLAEKNIRGLSLTYLKLADEIIQAKRGRNVEKYGVLSEEADLLKQDIRSFIEILNMEQFSRSSENYLSLVRRLNHIQFLCRLLLVLMFIGNTLITMQLTRKIMKPLNTLKNAANSVAEGNLSMKELPIVRMDEIGIVTDAFNKMLSSIGSYIQQIQENMERENTLKENEFRMQEYLKDAQLKYLQAQIEPHFLFNTLNAGVQLAMMEEAEDTQKLLESTAAFYRYNVSKIERDATIKEEIEQVDAYIYISEVRFKDRFIFEKNIDENLVEKRIPSMILQPLVENSMKYGVKEVEYMGRIELSVEKVDKGIRISVWDNGIGMTREMISRILGGKKENRGKESTGVGLYNVTERLRLYFNGRASLEIESEGEGMGTEVIITIPDDEEV